MLVEYNKTLLEIKGKSIPYGTFMVMDLIVQLFKLIIVGVGWVHFSWNSMFFLILYL